MFTEPLAGRRWVDITERRTKTDWAHKIRELVEERYPEAFDPEEAKRLAQKLEIHYTPKHGSWLNMAEIELSVLSRQCLNRRVPDFETLTAGPRLATKARREGCEDRLALQHRRCTHQAQAAIPFASGVTVY